MPPKAHRDAGGLCALPCSVSATPAVPLPALGLGPSGLRGHQVWGCGMANPPSSFTTASGCHHSGAISNKMRHLPWLPPPSIAGEPSAPSALQGVSPQGDPWSVGSTPVFGFAHRAGQTDNGPPNSQPPLPASRLHTERGISQGLGSPQAAGFHPATGSGWIQPLALGMESCVIT